jgi:RNA polymerase sigma factor (TIGR02999 family)
MVAGKYMRGERAGHTLQATAIVNEAYIRLVESEIKPEDQTHFFRLAAQAMRNILVDHARAKHRVKREAPTPEELGVLIEPASLSDEIPLDVLDIDRALTVLKQSNVLISEIFEQRYLLGQTVEELALMYNVSTSTVQRDLRFARAWLASYCKRNPRSSELENVEFLDDVAD